MHSGNSVIIHGSAIIQQGLKNILLSGNISISDCLQTMPECAILGEYRNMLILIDVQFAVQISKSYKLLKKNGNTVIGIQILDSIPEDITVFDEVIYINDNALVIAKKTSNYIHGILQNKSGSQLTTRETEIISLVAQGYSSKQIADRLFISIHTAISHRKNITAKLGIKSISGLTLYAVLNNLVDSHL